MSLFNIALDAHNPTLGHAANAQGIADAIVKAYPATNAAYALSYAKRFLAVL
jgi:hypothetical protein